MILSHPTFENAIQFEDGLINVLVIENQKQFSSYLNEFYQQINGNEGSFAVYSDLSRIGFDKIKLILNPIELDVNSKEIINPVIRDLSKFSLDEDHYLETNTRLNELLKYFNTLLFDFDSDLFADEIVVNDLLKAANIKFEINSDILIEKIISYIRCCKRYLSIKLFIFVNLKSFLRDEELLLFYDYLSYEKIDVLLIESTSRNIFCEKECVTIIDQDLCEIHFSDR